MTGRLKMTKTGTIHSIIQGMITTTMMILLLIVSSFDWLKTSMWMKRWQQCVKWVIDEMRKKMVEEKIIRENYLTFRPIKRQRLSWFITVVLSLLCSLVAEIICALSRLEVTASKESTLSNWLVDSCWQLNKSYEMWVITVRTRWCLKWKHCAKERVGG